MEKIKKQHFIINLDKRKDRWKQVSQDVAEIGIDDPIRMKGIVNTCGLLGCAVSHIRCLEEAKLKKWDYVLIMEDDVHFPHPELVKDFIDKNIDKDFDVLFLGCVCQKGQKEGDLIRVLQSTCLHAYIVKSHYYERLLSNFYESYFKKVKSWRTNLTYDKNNIDVYVKKIQYYDKWYCPLECLATQKVGYSDNFYKISDQQHDHFNPRIE